MVVSTVLSLHRLIDYGLRDYGTAEWIGGDPECDHIVGLDRPRSERPLGSFHGGSDLFHTTPYRDVCGKCGATRIDKQIGLEQSPDEYVEAMVLVGRQLWRVLCDNGNWFLNLGDSYAGSNNGSNDYRDEKASISKNNNKYGSHKPGTGFNFKPKDLMMIPHRVAIALQNDGWYVRQDNVWAKGCSGNYRGGSVMPESCSDRTTRSHEYVFHLSKSARYFYDNEAVKEPSKYPEDDRGGRVAEEHKRFPTERVNGIRASGFYPTRNLRSVWVINPGNYPGSHFATFPPDLIEPCILAGCPETVCAECGAPYERVVESKRLRRNELPKSDPRYRPDQYHGAYEDINGKGDAGYNETKTLGWQPTCTCNAGTKPGVVLDPFVGSGTTCMVARKHRRNAIGLDLNFEYLNKNARERLVYGSFVEVGDSVKQLTIGAR